MPLFRYKGRSKEGKLISGMVEANDLPDARRILHVKEYFVVEISSAESSFSLAAFGNKFKRVKSGEIANFTRQLATMITAGLSIPETLAILRNQTPSPAFAQCLADLEHQIVGGSNLADALSNYPAYFSRIYLALVRAGETSGMLDKVLTRLADTLEAQREFRSKVAGAMVYPVIIFVGMAVVIFIMMTVVIPKLTELYKDFNMDLPASTKLLMAVSSFFVHFWWLIIGLTVAGIFLFKRWKQTPLGTLMIDSITLKIPLLGDLQKKVILVEFTRTLGMLIGSGIHILEGLQVLQNSLANVLYREAIGEISKKIEKGFPLGDSFANYPIFPAIVAQMLKVGEETGKLDDTLEKLSHYFQTETEHTVKGLTTAIEPIIMVFLGVGVGFIVISVITPIYNLTSQFK